MGDLTEAAQWLWQRRPAEDDATRRLATRRQRRQRERGKAKAAVVPVAAVPLGRLRNAARVEQTAAAGHQLPCEQARGRLNSGRPPVPRREERPGGERHVGRG